MKNADCLVEKILDRFLGAVLLGIGLLLSVIGITILPVIGLFTAAPFLYVGFRFMIRSPSEVCVIH